MRYSMRNDTSDLKRKLLLEHKNLFIEHHNHHDNKGSLTADHKAGYKNRRKPFVK